MADPTVARGDVVDARCVVVEWKAVTYLQTCPRCGRDFAGEEKEVVADAVVEHARGDHQHRLDRDVVLAHLDGVRPDERQA